MQSVRGAEFDDAKQYRLAFCSLAENAGHERCVDFGCGYKYKIRGLLWETPSQDPAPALHPCESYPFSPNCGAAAFETARDTRAEFCGQAGNATAPQCRGAIVSDPCILNPHGKDCDATYTDNRTQRVAFLRHPQQYPKPDMRPYPITPNLCHLATFLPNTA